MEDRVRRKWGARGPCVFVSVCSLPQEASIVAIVVEQAAALFTLLTTKSRTRKKSSARSAGKLWQIFSHSQVFHKTGIGFKVRIYGAHEDGKLCWRAAKSHLKLQQ